MKDTIFIVNPISGGRRKASIIRLLEKTGCKVVCTQYPGHAEELSRECAEGTVVAVGGDGTVNEVARGLLGSGKRFGIIPCGSGDGLALHLGISRNPRKALRTLERGRTSEMDCASINGKVFFSVCGIGLDAMVSEAFAKSGSRGLATYIREAIRLWRGFKPLKCTLEVDGKSYDASAVLITVANSDQWGNGARIAPLSDCTDGFLDITLVQMFSSIEIPFIAFRLMTGSLHKCRRVSCFRGREIRIAREQAGPAHFDGDFFPADAVLDIRMLPQKISVIH